MSKSITVFISGSSGAGKNTIINRLITDVEKSEFIVSNTTRQRRDSDRKVGQYKYITKEEFEKKIEDGDILEYDIYNDNYYGLSKKDILDNVDNDKVLLKDLTVKGVLNCKDLLKDVMPLCCVFVTEKKSVLKERLKLRGETKKSIKNRLAVYRQEQEMIPYYDYKVVNNNLDKVVNELKGIINTNKNGLPVLTNVSCQEINQRKIDKYVNKLENGKKLKPIYVGVNEDRVYILEGVNKYLAYLKAGKEACLHVYHKPYKITHKEDNVNEWVKIVESYK